MATVRLSFQDDNGEWHLLAEVPAQHYEELETPEPMRDDMLLTAAELDKVMAEPMGRPKHDAKAMHELFGRPRIWRFVWVDDNGREIKRKEQRLSVGVERIEPTEPPAAPEKPKVH